MDIQHIENDEANRCGQINDPDFLKNFNELWNLAEIKNAIEKFNLTPPNDIDQRARLFESFLHAEFIKMVIINNRRFAIRHKKEIFEDLMNQKNMGGSAYSLLTNRLIYVEDGKIVTNKVREENIFCCGCKPVRVLKLDAIINFSQVAKVALREKPEGTYWLIADLQ